MPYPTPTGPAGNAANGAAAEQALNQLKYKRFLESIAGFAPGESDLPDEEILRRRALAAQGQPQAQGQAQPQAATGYVTGNAAPQQASLAQAPFQAIVNHIRMHPGMAAHLEGIDPGASGVPNFPPVGQPPMDPMGRARWQNMMAQRQQLVQAAQEQSDQRKAQYNQAMLRLLQAHDPLFAVTYNRLDSYVQRLPEKVQRPYLEAVVRTPGAFLDLYAHIRQGVERALHNANQVSQPMPQPGSSDPRARIRQAVAGRMTPPTLESAGVHDDRLPGASRKAELAAIKARGASGKARKGDLLRYIELSSAHRLGDA